MLKDHNFSLFVTWPWFLRQTFVLPIYNLVSKQTVLKYHGLFPSIWYSSLALATSLSSFWWRPLRHTTHSLCVLHDKQRRAKAGLLLPSLTRTHSFGTAKTLAIWFSWKNRKLSFYLLTFHFIPSDTEKLSSLFNWPWVEGGTLGSIIVLVTAGYFRNSA